MYLPGCYASHEDLSCEAGQCDGARAYGESQESEEVGSNPAAGHRSPNGYPGPCPFEYDSAHCWCVSPTHEVCDGKYCEGPYVGCIAPGSPVSSTWEGRP